MLHAGRGLLVLL